MTSNESLTRAEQLLARLESTRGELERLSQTEDADRAKIEGTVVLYIKITPDGRANSVKVTRSLGMGLDESAVAAVKEWRFRPGRKNGKPMAMGITIEVNFRLDGRDREEPCRAQMEAITI